MIDMYNFLCLNAQNERKSSNFATVIIQISEQQTLLLTLKDRKDYMIVRMYPIAPRSGPGLWACWPYRPSVAYMRIIIVIFLHFLH